MNRTSIEWVKNPDGTQGYTWNPITGCLNHINGMCKGGNFPCYAYRLAHGRLRERYKANINVAPVSLSTHPSAWAAAVNSKQLLQTLDPFYPRFWFERLCDVIRGYHRKHFVDSTAEFAAKPRGIFVCDMSDLFGIGIPEDWTHQVLKAINDWDNRHDRFYLLTKQPQNLIKFSPFPDNCWVGGTATDHDGFLRAVNGLRRIKAKVKYISFEPLLKEIPVQHQAFYYAGINWVIIGAQTKPYKPPKIEWVEEILKACDKASIPVFLKDNLIPLLRDNVVGWKHDPHYLIGGTLRQEMPK